MQSTARLTSRADAGRTRKVHDVPQELLAEIASHVEDTKSLKALALVSRAWLAPAQRYVFAVLTLLERAPPGRGAQDLLDLLKHAPYLAGYVTHLTVQEHLDDLDSRRKWESTLCELLPQFACLARFSLAWTSHTRWTWAHTPGAPKLTPELAEVLRATLHSPQLIHVEFTAAPLSWVQLLTPRVKSLALLNPFIDVGTGARRNTIDVATNKGPEDTGGPAVDALPFAHVQPTALLIDGLDWASCHEIGKAASCVLQAGLDVSRLRKLGLGLISEQPRSHESVANFLQACGRTLEVLSLTPAFGSYAPARDNYGDAINLATLPRLRELHISAQAGIVHNEVDVEPVLWLLAQLRRMPPVNRLRKVVLSSKVTVYETVHNNAYFGLSFESYGTLQTLLLDPKRFPKFRMFINYTEDPDATPSNKLLKWIAMSMAQYTWGLMSRNSFSFKYGGPYRPQIFPAHASW